MRLQEAGKVGQGWTMQGRAEALPLHLEQRSAIVMVLNRRLIGSQPVCRWWTSFGKKAGTVACGQITVALDEGGGPGTVERC